MDVKLLPIDLERDLERAAAILSSVEEEPITADELRIQWDFPEGAIFRLMKAVVTNGEMAGFCFASNMPWMPNRFTVFVIVDPPYRELGIGARLYEELDRQVMELGAKRLDLFVRESSPQSLLFAVRRGFVTDRHIFESTLDLASFDESRFAGTIEAVEASGIHLASYSELCSDPEVERKFYDLDSRLLGDAPGWDRPPLPFEVYLERMIHAPHFYADGTFIALDGKRWIGYTFLQWIREANLLYNAMTGVLPEYRGQKIALALKLRAIREAKGTGAPRIRTNNDEMNAPMLAINRKLGYQPVPGGYRMVKMLE